ncbi:MAG: ATP-grasp domain-containing protein [Phycisphaerales bacterium]|nr:MAG: ATP-grasp domain-containing protein [Phycisphaerales bacterium]
MKIAVVYNRESRNVINLFGLPNKEKIGLQTIKRVTDALKKGGHQVTALEGDKDLVDRLEHFMPRVVKGERPGMVFNVSYGIQGQARYTHVPSILEMVGIPYVASGPLAHSLALDKVVTKMILCQHGLPTPDFVVLDSPGTPVPGLKYPLIVKPKNEAVSFGLKIVRNESELREAAGVIFDEYRQPVLVEQYIDGREINVGLLGNNPPEALPPVELVFGKDGPAIYTFEDKTGTSGRGISHACPASIGKELNDRSQELAVRAFTALGCCDCARVDMRLDKDGNLYILEVNSLPSLGEHGSYLVGAAHVGLDFMAVVNRLVEAASARYFGTPEPPKLDGEPIDPARRVFSFITQRRDELERRLKEWTDFSSHTADPIGIQEAVRRVRRLFEELGMRPAQAFTDERVAWTWETAQSFEGGTLFIGHLDVPSDLGSPAQMFRRDPEWLYGDGIGSSRAPLVMLEFALRALRSMRQLRRLPVGVLYYADEGRDVRYSAEIIRAAATRAKRVLVLRPGNLGDFMVTQRRGQRNYRFRAVGGSLRPGKLTKKPEALRWMWNKLEAFSQLTSREKRVSLSTVDLKTETMPMHAPHRVTATILATYPDAHVADQLEDQMRALLDKKGPRWELDQISDRPPMKERRATIQLAKKLTRIAEEWDITLKRESSVWPSVAGLVPAKTACLCGIGPVARDVGTPHEAVQRISLVQRTLLLAEFLVREGR